MTPIAPATDEQVEVKWLRELAARGGTAVLHHGQLNALLALLDAAEAERDRLRAALRDLLDSWGNTDEYVAACRKARSALAEGAGDE